MAEMALEEASREVRDLFNKGFSAFERGNLDYAVDLLFSCVEKEPRLLQARKFLRAAEVQRAKKKKTNAFSQLMSTVKGMPGLALVKSGKPEQALMAAEKLLRDAPLNVKFVKAFAQAAVNADLPEAAIQTLELARDHHPEDIAVLNWLGSLYQKVGRTRSARECFEKLCEICPNNPDAMKSLKDAMAWDSMSSDGWEAASEDGGSYRDIIKDADEAALLEQEAKAVKSDKDADALIADALAKIELEPENINYYRTAAKLYVQMARFDDALELLGRAVEVSSGDPELENAVSETTIKRFDYDVSKLREAGQNEEATALEYERTKYVFENLQERVKRYPNDLSIRYAWGVMLFDNDYANEAIQQFQLSQRSPQHRVRSLYYLAMCFKKKGQHDLAVEQLEQAGEEIYGMDDTKKDIYYQIGEIAELMGDTSKAADYYKRIYQVDIGYRDIAEKVEKAYSGSAKENTPPSGESTE